MLRPKQKIRLDVSVECLSQRAVIWSEEAFGPGIDLSSVGDDMGEMLAATRCCAIRLPSREFVLHVNGESFQFGADGREPTDIAVNFAPGGVAVRQALQDSDNGRRSSPAKINIIESASSKFGLVVAVVNSNEVLGLADFSICAIKENGGLVRIVSHHKLEHYCLPTYPKGGDSVTFEVFLDSPPAEIVAEDHLMNRELRIRLRPGGGKFGGLIILAAKRIGMLFEHADGTKETIDPTK